jgi:phospholipid/cholesterol/gamma-HCH transport system ATP-binding protein
MAATRSSVLSLDEVVPDGWRSSAASTRLDLTLGHGEVALIEMVDESDAELLVDLCLGLAGPLHGEIHFLGRDWHDCSYHEALSRRGRIGCLVGTNVWPAHVSVAELVLTPWLHHSGQEEEEALGSATVLARRFGLPGLPIGTRESVPAGQLARAACVRAFLGNPDFVLIADPSIESMGELAVVMAQSIGAVQDRGGAVLWIVASATAPAARFVAADHRLRLGDRGLVPARRAR